MAITQQKLIDLRRFLFSAVAIRKTTKNAYISVDDILKRLGESNDQWLRYFGSGSEEENKARYDSQNLVRQLQIIVYGKPADGDQPAIPADPNYAFFMPLLPGIRQQLNLPMGSDYSAIKASGALEFFFLDDFFNHNGDQSEANQILEGWVDPPPVQNP